MGVPLGTFRAKKRSGFPAQLGAQSQFGIVDIALDNVSRRLPAKAALVRHGPRRHESVRFQNDRLMLQTALTPALIAFPIPRKRQPVAIDDAGEAAASQTYLADAKCSILGRRKPRMIAEGCFSCRALGLKGGH
jgi:hypothetical protein